MIIYHQPITKTKRINMTMKAKTPLVKALVHTIQVIINQAAT